MTERTKVLILIDSFDAGDDFIGYKSTLYILFISLNVFLSSTRGFCSILTKEKVVKYEDDEQKDKRRCLTLLLLLSDRMMFAASTVEISIKHWLATKAFDFYGKGTNSDSFLCLQEYLGAR